MSSILTLTIEDFISLYVSEYELRNRKKCPQYCIDNLSKGVRVANTGHLTITPSKEVYINFNYRFLNDLKGKYLIFNGLEYSFHYKYYERIRTGHFWLELV